MNEDMSTSGDREDCLLPLVQWEELVDVGVEISKGGVKVQDLPAGEGNKDGGVVVEGVGPHPVKRFAKIFIGP